MSDPTFVLLYVDDPAASAAFYATLLGRPPVESSPNFVMFALESGVMLGLWSRHEVTPAATTPGGGELAFTVADADAVRAHARGVERARAHHRAGAQPARLRVHVRRARSRRAPPARVRAGGAVSRSWLAVASGEHVERGRAGGFMQVCHGKAAPLRRVQPGDRVVYYSPTVSFQGRDRLQAFTAVGVVKEGEPYPFDMGGGFRPFRRDVRWLAARAAPVAPLVAAPQSVGRDAALGVPAAGGAAAGERAGRETIARAMGAALPPG